MGLSLAGCASMSGTPPSTGASTSASTDSNSEYDGWLFKSITGRNKTANASSTNASSATANASTAQNAVAQATPGVSQVQQTSYISNDASSPLIPVPLPNGKSSTSVGGPPPTIPNELPNAVSISDVEIEKKKADEKKGFEWADLAPENIYKNLKAAAGYGPNEAIAKNAMKDGQDLFRQASTISKQNTTIPKEAQELFKKAAVKFAEAADRWPDTPLEEDALFLQGESEFFSDQYPKAHDTYGGLLKKYANSRHLDTVVRREFAMGLYWEQLQTANPMWVVQPNLSDKTRPYFDTFGYALQAYDRVRLSDPTGPLADHSVMATANAYFRNGQYYDAAYHYDLLRKDYPNSTHQMKAHLLDLQAKMRVYQGVDYDGTPLKEGEKIANQTLSQFGNKLGAEREHVVENRARIIEAEADRDFTRGKYYEQHKYYGAAKSYYKDVYEKYPTTQRAQEAKACFEKIRNLPDEPPKRFAWLTNLFDPDD
jgi:outer membrane protein assembly factor BamD (BamD/ComL family)